MGEIAEVSSDGKTRVTLWDHLGSRLFIWDELGDHELKAIAQELTEFLRKNLKVDWSVRESVRAMLRGRIKILLRRHKYPPDLEQRAIDLVMKQAEAIGEAWGEVGEASVADVAITSV